MPPSENGDCWLGPPPDGRGRVIVVSGPSGSGKSTLVRLLAKDPNIRVSISATTRPPGPREQDGVEYYFLPRRQFEKDIEAGRFIEYAEYGGHLYGTPKDPVDNTLREGKWCLLEIEVQGALQIRKLYADALTVFIEPPSEEVLRERLARRKRDNAEAMERRVAIARQEMEQKHHYDLCIVNDDLSAALDTLKREIKKRGKMGTDGRRLSPFSQ